MLQVFHAFKKSYAVVLIVIAVVFVMTGFGVDIGGGGRQKAAILVNGEEISYQEFAQARKNLESRYQQMLGENYAKFAGAIRLNQQLVDSLVANKLLEGFAKDLGFVPSRAGVRELLLSSGLFAKGYDENLYRSYLQQVGMTSQQFEEELANETLTSQLTSLVMQSANSSDAEVAAGLIKQDTAYDVVAVKLSEEKFAPKVKDPAEDVLKKFFEDNSTDYETAAKVSYKYVVFDPTEWAQKVDILPEDIEFYYTENQSRYKLPEEVKISRIQFNYGKNDSVEKMAELKTKAEEAYAKALAGESFESLVQVYSDDYVSKALGGDLGWIKRDNSELASEVLKAAFSLKKGTLSELISTAAGYEIIKVGDKRESQFKPIESVKAEIEQFLRADQGPAYAAAKAQDSLDAWSKSGKSLEDFAKGESLKVEGSADMRDASQDPAGLFRLTAEILKMPDLKSNLIELGDKSILVSLTEYAPAEVPAFDKVKKEVLAAWKKSETKRLMIEEADAILAATKAETPKTLSEIAKAKALNVEVTKGISRMNPGAAPLSNPSIQEEVFEVVAPMQAPNKYHTLGTDTYLVQVTAISKPEISKIADKIKTAKAEEAQRLGRLVMTSIVNDLKAKAEIKIGDGIDLNA
jgi:peptidyl-prolyl cis-trans isomerase D